MSRCITCFFLQIVLWHRKKLLLHKVLKSGFSTKLRFPLKADQRYVPFYLPSFLQLLLTMWPLGRVHFCNVKLDPANLSLGDKCQK